MVDVFARTLQNDWTADWRDGERNLGARVESSGRSVGVGAPSAVSALMEAVGEVNAAAQMALERLAATMQVEGQQIADQQDEMRRRAQQQAGGSILQRVEGFLRGELAVRRLEQAQSRMRQAAVKIVGDGDMLARIERIDPALGKLVRSMGKFEAEKPQEFEPKDGPADYESLVGRYREAMIEGNPKAAARLSRDRALMVKALLDDPVSLSRLNAGLDASTSQVLFQDLEAARAVSDPLLARSEPGKLMAEQLIEGLPAGAPEARYAALRRQLGQEQPGLADMNRLRAYEIALGDLGRQVAGNPLSVAYLSQMDAKLAETAAADAAVAKAVGAMPIVPPSVPGRQNDYADLLTRYRDSMVEGRGAEAEKLSKARMAMVAKVFGDPAAVVNLTTSLAPEMQVLFQDDLARLQIAQKGAAGKEPDKARLFADEVLQSLSGGRPEEKYLALEQMISAEKGKKGFGTEDMTRLRGFQMALKTVTDEVAKDPVALSRLGGRNPKLAMLAVANAAMDGLEANVLPESMLRKTADRGAADGLTELGVMRSGEITRRQPVEQPQPGLAASGSNNVVQLDDARPQERAKQEAAVDFSKAMRLPLESDDLSHVDAFKKMRAADLAEAYKASDGLAKQMRGDRAITEDGRQEHDKLELARRAIGDELVSRGMMKKEEVTPEMMLSKRGQQVNQRVTAAKEAAKQKALRAPARSPSTLGDIKEGASRGMRTGTAIARGAERMLG